MHTHWHAINPFLVESSALREMKIESVNFNGAGDKKKKYHYHYMYTARWYSKFSTLDLCSKFRKYTLLLFSSSFIDKKTERQRG